MPRYASAKDIYDLLSEGVHGQDEAKRVIAASVARHLVCSAPDYPGEYQKANILIIGNSGTGKTELIRQLKRTQSQWCDNPFPLISFDGSKITGTGWRGANIEDILVQLHLANKGQLINETERGIIHIDEIDKLIAADTGEYPTGALNALLTMIEGSTLPIDSSKTRDVEARYEDVDGVIEKKTLKSVNTEKVLFILSGVFENFEKTFQNKTLGFNKDDEKGADVIYSHEELMKRAHIPAEFMGRISQITTTHHIKNDQLVNVLDMVCARKYKPLLSAYNIRYKSVFTKKFLTDIVSNSYSKHMGMRLCCSKIDEHLADLLFDKAVLYEIVTPDKDLSIEEALAEAKEESNDQ